MRRVLFTCLAAGVVLAGCGGTTFGDLVPGSLLADDGELACGEARFDRDELDAMPSAATLPDEVLAAVDDLGEPALDTSLDWRVVERSDEEVVLLRELESDEPAAAATGESHAVTRLAPVTGAPNLDDGTWFVWGGGTCSIRLAAGAGDDQAELRLGDTPSPHDTELPLLVMERRCASGRDAEGRIDLDELTLTEDQVQVRVSVRAPPGNEQTCPGNPWTPFPVDLGEPLGDREVVDANLVPPRPLVVGTAEPTFDPDAEDPAVAVERALAFEPPADYTMTVETTCFCPGGVFEVVVRGGEPVARRLVEAAGDPEPPAEPGVEPGAALAPTISEVQARLRELWQRDPTLVTDIAVEMDGSLVRLALDPLPNAADDEIAYEFGIDVDSPGDPVG